MTSSTPNSGKVRIALMDWVGGRWAQWEGRGVPRRGELSTMLSRLRGFECPPEKYVALSTDPAEPVTDLPSPIAGGHAWRALRRIDRLLLNTQGWFAVKAGYTGAFYAPAGVPGLPSSRTDAPPAPEELPPLRVLDVDTADITVLTELAATLQIRPVHWAIAEVTAHQPEKYGFGEYDNLYDTSKTTLIRVTEAAHQLAALLATPQNFTAEEHTMIDMVAATPPSQDIHLDIASHRTYQRLALAL